jgi:hypothetical protein
MGIDALSGIGALQIDFGSRDRGVSRIERRAGDGTGEGSLGGRERRKKEQSQREEQSAIFEHEYPSRRSVRVHWSLARNGTKQNLGGELS